jgi:hypothetical protein
MEQIRAGVADLAIEMKEEDPDTDGKGICIGCGAEADGGDWIEPDAEKYKCRECGEFKVYGVDIIIIMTVA